MFQKQRTLPMSKNSEPLSIFDERTDRLLPTVVCTVFQVDVTAPVANLTEQEIYLLFIILTEIEINGILTWCN